MNYKFIGDGDGDDAERMNQIARLAQQLTGIMLAVAHDERTMLNWQDVCFAAAVSMKALGGITSEAKQQHQQVDDVDLQLPAIFKLAMDQPVLTKRFTSERELEDWIAERLGDDAAPAAGAVN